MFLIGLDEAASLKMITSAASHLPIGASLGRVLAVTQHGILTEDDAGAGALFGVDFADDCVWRVVDIDSHLSERTTWRNGTEIDRQVVHAQHD